MYIVTANTCCCCTENCMHLYRPVSGRTYYRWDLLQPVLRLESTSPSPVGFLTARGNHRQSYLRGGVGIPIFEVNIVEMGNWGGTR